MPPTGHIMSPTGGIICPRAHYGGHIFPYPSGWGGIIYQYTKKTKFAVAFGPRNYLWSGAISCSGVSNGRLFGAILRSGGWEFSKF